MSSAYKITNQQNFYPIIFSIKNFALLFCVFFISIGKAQKNIDSSDKEKDQTVSSFISCLLPAPQKVAFSSKTFSLDTNWAIENVGATENNIAYECLVKGLKEK